MNITIAKIREATADTEYEGFLYLVGGVVRDKVMGLPPSEDIDIVLEGNALALAQFLYDKGIGDHKPVTYPRFGTAMLSVQGHIIELVSARRESYGPESRNPKVEHAGLYDDVLRRDFTINTLLENLHTGEILDLTEKGITDIEAKIIRTPTEPQTTFYDDPLRMLRAVRFAVRFDFQIEGKTYGAILRDAERLTIISKERIRDEFVKILLDDDPARGLSLLKETRLLEQFAPELLEMQDIAQDGGHVYDVWGHTIKALEALPHAADLILRLAVLFHDIGKPQTQSRDEEGHYHFYGHEELGSKIARKILNRLRFPSNQTTRVARLIELHMRIGEYRHEWKDAAVKRLMRDASGDISDLLALARADRLGANPNASVQDLDELEHRIENVLMETTVEELRSPLDGKEIMELLKIPPGPEVQEVKDFLCDEVIEGRLSSKDKETAHKIALRKFASNS